MKIPCQCCGAMVDVNGLGRTPLGIPVNNVCDALVSHHSVIAAAVSLGCSRGYIYQALKTEGLDPRFYTGKSWRSIKSANRPCKRA